MTRLQVSIFILSQILCFTASQAEESILHCDKVSHTFNKSEFSSGNREIAGSPPLLRHLAEKDEAIFYHVQTYLKENSVSNCAQLLLERYVSHFQSTTAIVSHFYTQQNCGVQNQAHSVAWNPLAVFHLFYRFRRFLMPAVAQLNSSSEFETQLKTNVMNEMVELGWPSESDYQFAASAIMRIQLVYDLDTANVSNGVLHGEGTGILLSARDCDSLGRQALQEGNYAFAVEWFERARELLPYNRTTDLLDPLGHQIVENSLELAGVVHDGEFERSPHYVPQFFVNKVSEEASEPRIRRRTNELELWRGREGLNFNGINYWGLCSGENYQTEANKSKLFCYYETKSSPYWTINPLKVELLSLQPLLIFQYHDLMGDKMIDKIKTHVGTNLTLSRVLQGKDYAASQDVRSSLNTWIDDNVSDEFGSVGKTIEAITGLKVHGVSSSEQMQVASYSAGSHYNVHPDARGQSELEESGTYRPHGERIATFLYYLSDVVKGGQTAFPQSGVASNPIRGSAVFWLNLRKSLEMHDYTWHGSCPVILGEKWIANKWILSYDQMFHPNFKCSTDPDDIVEMTINGRPISEFY